MQVGSALYADECYILKFPPYVQFSACFSEQVIYHRLLGSGVAQSTFTHLLQDQVLPRLIAHDGIFVLHGGGVVIDDKAVAIVAPTRHGKSTLCASLQKSGNRLLGDDSLVVSHGETGPTISAVYSSLRLLPDSISQILGTDVETRDMAQYSEKRHVIVKSTEPMETTAPLNALIFLTAPEPHVRLRRMAVAEACMSLIANSFALDPTDPVWASENMRRASALAAHVPAYALSYPRDYKRLGDVNAAIQDIVTRISQVVR